MSAGSSAPAQLPEQLSQNNSCQRRSNQRSFSGPCRPRPQFVVRWLILVLLSGMCDLVRYRIATWVRNWKKQTKPKHHWFVWPMKKAEKEKKMTGIAWQGCCNRARQRQEGQNVFEPSCSCTGFTDSVLFCGVCRCLQPSQTWAHRYRQAVNTHIGY